MPTVQDLQAAGFSDDEVKNWATQQRSTLQGAGFSDKEIDDHLTGIKLPDKLPKSFIDRIVDPLKSVLLSGQMPIAAANDPLTRFVRGVGTGLTTGYTGTPLGDEEKKSMSGPEAAGLVVGAIPAIMASPIHTGAKALEATLNGEPVSAEEMATASFLGLHAAGRVARMQPSPEGFPIREPIGAPPLHEDFVNGAAEIAHGNVLPHVEQKLLELYEDHGIHPAEVVADAKKDPTIEHEMLSANPGLPAEYVGDGVARPEIEIPENVKYEFEKFTIPIIDEPGTGGFIIKRNGEPIAKVSMTVEGNNAKIESISTYTEPGVIRVGRGVPNSLGPRELRSIARAYLEANPEVQTISGLRATGARAADDRVPGSEANDDVTVNRKQIIGPHQSSLTFEEPAGGGRGGPPEPPRIEPPTIEGEPPPPKPPMTADEARESILSKISIGEREPNRGWSFSRLYTDWLDAINPIKLLTKGDKLPAELDPYVAYRELVASASKADAMLMKQGVWDFNAPNEKPLTRSLADILEPVKKTEDLDTFRVYAAASRAIELTDRGIEHPFDPEAARIVMDTYGARMQPILDELINFQNNILMWLRDSGILSKAGYDKMLDLNKSYVPFYRVLDQPLEHSGRGGTLMATNPIKRIVGSERTIVDPLESVIKNTFMYTSMAERNAAARLLVDFLDKKGEAPKIESGSIPATALQDAADFAAWLEHYGVPKNVSDELTAFIQSAATPVEGDGTISLFRDGIREHRSVDTEVARAVRGMDRESVSAMMRFVSNWTNLLRAGSTLVPEFGARHLTRDFLYAFVTSAHGAFSPVWMVRGIMNGIKKGEVYDAWVRSGGANVTYQAFDRRYLQEDLRTLTNDTGLMNRAWNVVASPTMSVGEKAGTAFRAALHPLQAFTEIAQSASHLGAFERALTREGDRQLTREDYIRAGWESRTTAVDISRRGAKMQSVNQIVAFANATAQDTARWIEAFGERPYTTAFRVTAGITIPSVMLWAWQHDDPIYREVPQWEKDLFWVITTGENGPIIRIPKPWGMGLLFGSGVERMLESLYDSNPNAFKGFAESIMKTNVPSLIPTPIVPVLEQWANKSFFTGRSIIPASMEKLLPEYQYTQYTTEVAKSIGHIIGAFYPGGVVSPITIEHYVAGWTGQLGKYVMDAADLALRKSGVLPDPTHPSSTLADIPVIKAFIARYPNATTQSLQDFHDEYNRRTIVYDTWRAKAMEGDAAALKHIQDIGGSGMFIRMTGINEAIGRSQRTIQNVWRNEDMSASDKRQLIDKMYSDMIAMAKAGNAAMRASAQAQ